MKAMKKLSQLLGYDFQEITLLKIALTHCSRGGEHNERLEFLGDSVVNLIIALLLYRQFPTAHEGQLSRWRASLVNRDRLAELAKQFKLDQYLLLGEGELRTGGNQRQSILSCAMEAIIGAIFLDSNFAMIYHRLEQWYQPLLAALSHEEDHKDPKTILQEYTQRHHLPLPLYIIEKTTGKAHEQQFIVSCSLSQKQLFVLGQGTSRRRAEQAAARALLAKLTEAVGKQHA